MFKITMCCFKSSKSKVPEEKKYRALDFCEIPNDIPNATVSDTNIIQNEKRTPRFISANDVQTLE